jgi:hypothetical protein
VLRRRDAEWIVVRVFGEKVGVADAMTNKGQRKRRLTKSKFVALMHDHGKTYGFEPFPFRVLVQRRST